MTCVPDLTQKLETELCRTIISAALEPKHSCRTVWQGLSNIRAMLPQDRPDIAAPIMWLPSESMLRGTKSDDTLTKATDAASTGDDIPIASVFQVAPGYATVTDIPTPNISPAQTTAAEFNRSMGARRTVTLFGGTPDPEGPFPPETPTQRPTTSKDTLDLLGMQLITLDKASPGVGTEEEEDDSEEEIVEKHESPARQPRSDVTELNTEHPVDSMSVDNAAKSNDNVLIDHQTATDSRNGERPDLQSQAAVHNATAATLDASEFAARSDTVPDPIGSTPSLQGASRAAPQLRSPEDESSPGDDAPAEKSGIETSANPTASVGSPSEAVAEQTNQVGLERPSTFNHCAYRCQRGRVDRSSAWPLLDRMPAQQDAEPKAHDTSPIKNKASLFPNGW